MPFCKRNNLMIRYFKRTSGMLLTLTLLLCSCDSPLGGLRGEPPTPPPGGGPSSFTVTGELATWKSVICQADEADGAYYPEWSYKSAPENDDQYHRVASIDNTVRFCFTEAGSYCIKLEVAPGIFTAKEVTIAASPAPSQEPDLALLFTRSADGTFAGSLIASDNLLKSFRCESPTGEALEGLSIRFETLFLDRNFYYLYLWKPVQPGEPAGFYDHPSEPNTPHIRFVKVNETIEPKKFPNETSLSGSFTLDDIRKISKVSNVTNLKYSDNDSDIGVWQRLGGFDAGFIVITDSAPFRGITIPISLSWENLDDGLQKSLDA
jgi:hypothetical protein